MEVHECTIIDQMHIKGLLPLALTKKYLYLIFIFFLRKIFPSSKNEKKKKFFKMGSFYVNGVNLFEIQSLFEYSIEIYSTMDDFNKARTITT